MGEWRINFNILQFNEIAKRDASVCSIVINCFQGYYRVHYDEENWKLLTQALEENHEAFPAETRASLIDDVLGLAAVGLTKYATAFDFIKYMQMKERHYAPWGALMRHLLKLNGLLYETSGFSAFQVI